MAKKPPKKITTVREHPMHVPVSEKNPTGLTIRDRHLRRLKGTYLDAPEIESIFKDYDRKDIVYPMGVRWLFRKRATAMNQLKRAPNHEELILEYKGLLKSDSDYKKSGLKKYRNAYAELKK